MRDEATSPLPRAPEPRGPSPKVAHKAAPKATPAGIPDSWSAEGPKGLRARARSWLGLGARPVSSPAPAPAPARPAKGAAQPKGPARAEAKAGLQSREKPVPAKAAARKGGLLPLPGRGRRPVPAIADFLLILGAMKSGTTSLYDYLATHPEIAPCKNKEPSFFAAYKRERLDERYFHLWPDYDPGRHRYAMEASVDYTKQPRYRAVARRIRAFPARFSYLYIVRDPVDRIESHIAHNIAKGRITARDYAPTLARALAVSRYAYQLDRFRAGAGRPDVLLLDFDELRADPMTLLGRVVDFLGLDPGFAFEPRKPSNARSAENGGDRFRLGPEERARLHAELAPDMARFARVYGFDVARWGFTPEAYPEAFAAAALSARPLRKARAKARREVPAPVAAAPARAAPRAAPAGAALPAEEDPMVPSDASSNVPSDAPANSGPTYWDRRRDLVYYDYIRGMVAKLAAEATSLIDVGSYNTSISEEFDWIPERFALDIRKPYSSENVQGISADFLTFEPGRRYDFATCFQVLEHIEDAGAFARKLLSISDRVLVSVPYLWPEGKHPEHVHDPVYAAKLAAWFGRAPDYQIVAQEPLREGGFSRRLIAYFHTVPGERFAARSARSSPQVLPLDETAPRRIADRARSMLGIAAPAPKPAPAPKSMTASKSMSAPAPAGPAAPKARRGEGYWKRRRRMVYYSHVRAMVRVLAKDARRFIDVGSHQTSLAEEFDWIPKRAALDIRRPYHSEKVRGIKADFLTFTPRIRYDFATCFQVLEHVPDAGAFAQNLLRISDRVLVSVPYRWPVGCHHEHVQDPVDEAKLASWFGREPDYQIIVEEPLSKAVSARRLIAYYHNDPAKPFALRGPGPKAEARAAKREAERAARAERAQARAEARAARAARAAERAAKAEARAAKAEARAAKQETKRAAKGTAPTYWDRRRDLVYYDYIRAMAGRLAAHATSLIDVGSYNTSLSEEFDWIPERFALDIRKPYSSENVQGISADFLTFEPGRRYDFATCFQVLEHVPEAGAFAKKLLAVADHVLVSVPYLWPEGKHPEHVHDPVDEAKLAAWFGRAPDYQIVAQEPLRQGGYSRRLIAYFRSRDTGEPFDPHALPPGPPGRAAGGGYWDGRREMIYYDYIRAMVGRLGHDAPSLIDVGSNVTSLAEEFDWIPERFTLDLESPYASERVQGITADFLGFAPGRRYGFATCLQVLEHVPEAGAFAQKLLSISDRVLVSVPYRWPETRHAEHVHDPVTEEKLDAWFGRAPDYRLIVPEPLRRGTSGRRMLAYYHNVPGETFSLRALPARPRRGAGTADAQRPA